MLRFKLYTGMYREPQKKTPGREWGRVFFSGLPRISFVDGEDENVAIGQLEYGLGEGGGGRVKGEGGREKGVKGILCFC